MLFRSLLHDIGKLAVHPDILNKPGKLNDEEWAVIKKHPLEGAKLTAPLAGWEKDLSPIEATPAARMRWARAVQEADKPIAVHQPLLKNVWRIAWRELIWPSRLAWTGMAALWVVMLAVNGRLSDHRMIQAGARAPSAQEMLQAWEEQNRVLAELTQAAHVAPVAPSALPPPRSERERDWEII